MIVGFPWCKGNVEEVVMLIYLGESAVPVAASAMSVYFWSTLKCLDRFRQCLVFEDDEGLNIILGELSPSVWRVFLMCQKSGAAIMTKSLMKLHDAIMSWCRWLPKRWWVSIYSFLVWCHLESRWNPNMDTKSSINVCYNIADGSKHWFQF